MEIMIPLPRQDRDIRGYAQLLTADDPNADDSEIALIMVHAPANTDVTPHDLVQLLSSLLDELTNAVSEAS